MFQALVEVLVYQGVISCDCSSSILFYKCLVLKPSSIFIFAYVLRSFAR